MALNFPANPTVGQTYSTGVTIYTYNGVVWTGTADLIPAADRANDYATYQAAQANDYLTYQALSSGTSSGEKISSFLLMGA